MPDSPSTWAVSRSFSASRQSERSASASSTSWQLQSTLRPQSQGRSRGIGRANSQYSLHTSSVYSPQHQRSTSVLGRCATEPSHRLLGVPEPTDAAAEYSYLDSGTSSRAILDEDFGPHTAWSSGIYSDNGSDTVDLQGLAQSEGPVPLDEGDFLVSAADHSPVAASSAEFLEGTLSRPQSASSNPSANEFNRYGRASTPMAAWTTRKTPMAASAPLMRRNLSESSLVKTWYSKSPAHSEATLRMSPSGQSWKPLGSDWRDNDFAFSAEGELISVRPNVDEGGEFASGCVPRWNRDAELRLRSVVEHDLTWAYNRMKRHPNHVLRKEVGDPFLPNEDVLAQMRYPNKRFKFWSDLRPPFYVSELRRDAEASFGHPEGEIYHVVYECGIEYCAERMWNEKTVNGTFDNKIHGTATVRLPDGFPKRRHMVILSWGKPKLNWSPADDLPEGERNKRKDRHKEGEDTIIDPDTWMPIADELKLRPDHPRLARAREVTRRTKTQTGIEVAPTQKVLIGRHPSLRTCVKHIGGHEASKQTASDGSKAMVPKKAPRQFCIYTAAAGFVKYAG